MTPLGRVIEWPGTSILRRKLRKARIRSGLRQADLAKEIGVSRIALGFWERGIAKPKDEHLEKWQEALLRGR